MAKRPFEESHEDIKLDEVLRPRKQQRVDNASKPIRDPDNVMDNWYLSSIESMKERSSHDQDKQDAWASRKALDVQNVDRRTSEWRISLDNTERQWYVPRIKRDQLTQRAGDLDLNRPEKTVFPVEVGDREILSIYQHFWVCGDKPGFLDALEHKFGDKDTIPEEYVWRIFSCLIRALVPEHQVWEDIPPRIVTGVNTIWYVGKIMLQVLTRGRFWDEENNVLNPMDGHEPFGRYKQQVLQKKYSKNLMKYVLGCLSHVAANRPTRESLITHFNTVFSVYNGTFVHVDDEYQAEGPYQPVNKLIPVGLTKGEGKVYETLLGVVYDRNLPTAGTSIHKPPRIFTITDLAKDYDDLMAMMVLKELHRLGLVQLKGFVANLMPAHDRTRFGRGALDLLGLKDIPIGEGTRGSDEEHKLQSHEFANTKKFIVPRSTKFPSGHDLLKEYFSKAAEPDENLTLLAISSLMDVAEFAASEPEILRNGLKNVVLQGGYLVKNNVLTADDAAANNNFHLESAHEFHKFMQDNQVPSTVWTKTVATATPISDTLLEELEATGNPLGSYIRAVQVNQDRNFYRQSCSDKPFRSFMTQPWFAANKTSWFLEGHEPDEPYPEGEDMVPYFTKLVAYDALAAIGSAGKDVLAALDLPKPFVRRKDVEHTVHQTYGALAVTPIEGQPNSGKPAEANLNVERMGIVITALMKGCLLALTEGL